MTDTKETAHQKVILEYLQARPGVWVRKVPLGPMMVGRKSFAKNPLAGMPDILVCYRGQMVCLEVKKDKDQTTEKKMLHQKIVQQEIRDAGGTAVQVDSVDDVIPILDAIDDWNEQAVAWGMHPPEFDEEDEQ